MKSNICERISIHNIFIVDFYIHNRFVSQAREMEPDVLFVGDSLIANLQSTDLWEKWFVPMHSLNFGIGGDQTQNVLWRLHNGELECLKPKAVVILVGTNNHSNTAEEVAEGVMEICNTVREKQPQAYIIALTIPPRGQKHNSLREKNNKVNAMIIEGVKRQASMSEIINLQLTSMKIQISLNGQLRV
ncbi:Platelet-activating factor acetylhydrolase IB subunit beta [Armadillidium vulgare]|nr:Platelet-activating factor acetylhydrolase IB subunit beta [Armadillidium vulgare]